MESEVSDLTQFSESPREHIPDEWARKGRCPICGASKSLDIKHLSEAPDQFDCQQCGGAFEVQSTGSKIKLIVLPEVLKPVWNEVINRWMEPSDLQRLYQRHQSIQQQVAPQTDDSADRDDVAKPALSNREVMFRTLELHKLGNDFETIGLLLYQSGAIKKQVTGALRLLQKQVDEERKRRSRVMWAMGVGAFAVLVLIAVFLWFTSKTPDTQSASESTDNSDLLFSKINPGEIVTELMDVPTPQVVYSGPGNTGCPVTAAQAAELFGGAEGSWSKEQGFNAWTMMHAGAPVTIRVPANMVAGYMKLDNMQMVSIDGPATIQNVNFIVITCD